jgi:hypothetical protein
MPKINFEGVQSSNFEQIPAGIYPATVFSIEYKKARDKPNGVGYYEWQFAIQSDDHKSRRLWMNTSLEPQALWKLKDTIEAFGSKVPDGEFEFEPEGFFGKPCMIKVTTATYNGKDTNNVDDVLPANQGKASGGATTAKTSKPGKNSGKGLFT